jgi:hypothetical protein
MSDDTIKTYTGSCHCGAVKFDVKAELKSVMACNCSICSRAGYLLTFVPREQFKLHQGEDAQTDYQFAKKHVHHLFCKTCGIHSFSQGAGRDGKPMMAINVRCLEGVDVGALEVKQVDGRSL